MNYTQLQRRTNVYNISQLFQKITDYNSITIFRIKIKLKNYYQVKLYFNYSIEKVLKIHKFYYREFNTPNPVYSIIQSVLESVQGGGGSFNITSGDLLKKNPRNLDFGGSIFNAFPYLFLNHFVIFFLQSSQTYKAV